MNLSMSTSGANDDNLGADTHHADESLARSITKTLSYRVFVLVLDFSTIYFFTHKLSVAVGFTVVSNLYTTFAYFFHERVWDKIKWGRRISVRSTEGIAPPTASNGGT
jgi:adenylylsulfate kinase